MSLVQQLLTLHRGAPTDTEQRWLRDGRLFGDRTWTLRVLAGIGKRPLPSLRVLEEALDAVYDEHYIPGLQAEVREDALHLRGLWAAWKVRSSGLKWMGSRKRSRRAGVAASSASAPTEGWPTPDVEALDRELAMAVAMDEFEIQAIEKKLASAGQAEIDAIEAELAVAAAEQAEMQEIEAELAVAAAEQAEMQEIEAELAAAVAEQAEIDAIEAELAGFAVEAGEQAVAVPEQVEVLAAAAEAPEASAEVAASEELTAPPDLAGDELSDAPALQLEDCDPLLRAPTLEMGPPEQPLQLTADSTAGDVLLGEDPDSATGALPAGGEDPDSATGALPAGEVVAVPEDTAMVEDGSSAAPPVAAAAVQDAFPAESAAADAPGDEDAVTEAPAGVAASEPTPLNRYRDYLAWVQEREPCIKLHPRLRYDAARALWHETQQDKKRALQALNSALEKAAKEPLAELLAGLTVGTVLADLTTAELPMRMGCSKCRWKPGCTPSCYRTRAGGSKEKKEKERKAKKEKKEKKERKKKEKEEKDEEKEEEEKEEEGADPEVEASGR